MELGVLPMDLTQLKHDNVVPPTKNKEGKPYYRVNVSLECTVIDRNVRNLECNRVV
jgi:hypothetical protein